ncbi:MAG: hypothetical protein ABIQ86_05410 [Steroidobacteraceae bacterium]
MIVRSSVLLRRLALFFAMLMSGGWLLFPRLPLFALIAAAYLLLCGRRLSIDRRLAAVFVLLAVILLASLLRNAGADFGAVAIRLANFTAGLLLLDLYLRAGAEAFRRDLFGITHLMAWQALVTVILAKIASQLFLSIDVNGTAYQSFLVVANYHTTIENSGPFIRPDGFFYEPGVFQIYLNLFLYLALFVFRSARHALLGLAAVISTQSTTGLVIALMLVGVYAFRYINRGSLQVRLARSFWVGLLVIPLVVVVGLNVVDKVAGESRGSFWSRQYDLLTGVNVILEKPMVGIGFDYDAYYAASARLGYTDTQLTDRITTDRGNTNGIVFLLYSIGIPLALPFLIGMFRQGLFTHRGLIGILLFLSFLSESIIFTPFFLAVICGGMLLKPRSNQVKSSQIVTQHV